MRIDRVDSGVYSIVNKKNGYCYIGSTVNFKGRCYGHRCDLVRNRHSSPILQNSWNKYGEDHFDFYVIESVDVSMLLEREQYWMDLMKPRFNCA